MGGTSLSGLPIPVRSAADIRNTGPLRRLVMRLLLRLTTSRHEGPVVHPQLVLLWTLRRRFRKPMAARCCQKKYRDSSQQSPPHGQEKRYRLGRASGAS